MNTCSRTIIKAVASLLVLSAAKAAFAQNITNASVSSPSDNQVRGQFSIPAIGGLPLGNVNGRMQLRDVTVPNASFDAATAMTESALPFPGGTLYRGTRNNVAMGLYDVRMTAFVPNSPFSSSVTRRVRVGPAGCFSFRSGDARGWTVSRFHAPGFIEPELPSLNVQQCQPPIGRAALGPSASRINGALFAQWLPPCEPQVANPTNTDWAFDLESPDLSTDENWLGATGVRFSASTVAAHLLVQPRWHLRNPATGQEVERFPQTPQGAAAFAALGINDANSSSGPFEFNMPIPVDRELLGLRIRFFGNTTSTPEGYESNSVSVHTICPIRP